MNAIVGIIGRTAIFMVCAQTIIHFRANRSYEKYIRLLAGMMILALLLSYGFLPRAQDSAKQFEERVNWYFEKIRDGGWEDGEGMEKTDNILRKVDELQNEISEEGQNTDSGIREVEIGVKLQPMGGNNNAGDR